MRARNPSKLEVLLGASAIAFSVDYFVSDVIEAGQDGFTTFQLILTLIGELAIPFFVFGLYWVKRNQIGPIGKYSAIAYAYAYAFFTFTVVYALADSTPDYDQLSDDLAPWMVIHGAIMLVAGIGFGYSIIKTRAYPRWTGGTLIFGVVLVSATQGAPEGVELLAALLRDIAWAGMGLSLLVSRDASKAPADEQVA
jgi:hypothetical protein